MEEDANQPKKGILRNKSEDKHHSGIHWDEMNILMTHHPPDKDYGHMKINEPPTPYSKWKDPGDDEGEGTADPFSDDEADPQKLDPENLHDRIKDAPKRGSWDENADNDDDDDDDDIDEDLSESQKEHKKAFKDKRRVHYNEYSKVKLARKLIEQELKDLDDDDNDGSLDSAKEGSSSTDACAADTQMDET
ncbi:protein phosphatase inhibitor 2-like [Pocillopora damicornis]|uniref:protein phosphatase inhibitor 2-like n=1 Tax=Pocillopora damicornis TaxID=46731 RepID=UPI000F54F2E4|nr:protein phosphatase inhibitor 2-like [Pocillopora damicornis]